MRRLRKRVIWFSSLGAILLVLLLSRFYYSTQTGHWQEEAAAKRTAIAKAGLTSVESVKMYNGDDSYNVVTGKDAAGEKVIVWLSGEDMHVEKASAGIGADQAKSQLLQRSPGAKLLRAVPGKLGSDYVWELFYKKSETEGERYYYDYVKFADGSLIDTWRLSL